MDLIESTQRLTEICCNCQASIDFLSLLIISLLWKEKRQGHPEACVQSHPGSSAEGSRKDATLGCCKQVPPLLVFIPLREPLIQVIRGEPSNVPCAQLSTVQLLWDMSGKPLPLEGSQLRLLRCQTLQRLTVLAVKNDRDPELVLGENQGSWHFWFAENVIPSQVGSRVVILSPQILCRG